MIVGTYLSKLSTLILEVLPYHVFLLPQPHLQPFSFTFFGLFSVILRPFWPGSKTFLNLLMHCELAYGCIHENAFFLKKCRSIA